MAQRLLSSLSSALKSEVVLHLQPKYSHRVLRLLSVLQKRKMFICCLKNTLLLFFCLSNVWQVLSFVFLGKISVSETD